MQLRVKYYVAFIVLLAGGAVALACSLAPRAESRLGVAMLLCVLAVAGELLAFALPHRAMGSIGFIPYFAAAVLVPGWQSILAVVLVRTALEIASSRELIKRTLNIASHALMEAIAVIVFLMLGGQSLLDVSDKMNLTHVTADYGFAAIVAFTAAFFVNNIVIISAIALASGTRIWTIWLDSSRSTVVIDLITGPLIFVFAWVYSAFGPIAAAALWVPILGLRQVHRINVELERTNEELLELMVKSLEARDPYTSGHSRRVQHFSIVIAKAMGLGERQIEEIGRAALLHDVGKIYEKYASVLAKQDKLTPVEWAIIRDHPEDGAKLVATMTRLRDVVPAIRHHHENWDGTGYPDGLAGELIPLGSRIIRFADTIDAMTTERPYRGPLPEPAVRSEVVKCRGTQFDPYIADRLLSSSLWLALFSGATIAAEGTDRPRFMIIGKRTSSGTTKRFKATEIA
jgi:putative nucleotidyltransferase with HDIG domain